jgi:hypothetical protein
MILKIFKAVWFVSVLAVLVNLLFVYASLPEQVVVQEEVSGRTMANRELFFYAVTLVLAVINVMVYLFSPLYTSQEGFRSWFYGLIITINIFFILALNVIQVYNSAERFDFSSVGFIIYGSLGLMLAWALVWPLYGVFRKIFPKQAVS